MDEQTLPEPDWAAVRRAYELSPETISKICERFAVNKSSLERRCRKEQWLGRRARAAGNSTLKRLFAVLETQVTKLANADGDRLGDKEAQQLTELIKNFDKLSDIENDGIDKAANNGGPSQKKDMRDLREKLAKRIDQFNRR